MGTKDEVARLAAIGERPPADRVAAPEFGGPGWAIALHGNMVVHRGAPLTEQAERITMVYAYVALDRSRNDQSRARDLIGVDDESHLYAEWVEHVAWRAEGRLSALVDTTEFGLTRDEAIARLESVISDISAAIDDLRAGPSDTEHYEQRADRPH